MSQSTNPLQQFFRQPVIYLRLPSDGQHWSNGSLDMPANRELPILPMTAIDEITYKTPDALFNGSSIVSVVQSCVPNIKNAWKIPNTDLNAVLIAIRIASVGQDMDVETVCTSCGHTDSYSVNLTAMLEGMQKPDFSQVVRHGDLEVYFKPVDFETQNQINIQQFEQQKIIQAVQESDQSEDEKVQVLNAALKEITNITVRAIASSISGIKTPAALVSDPAYVQEFLVNCDRNLFAKIKDHAVNLRMATELTPMKLTCTECNSNYEQPVIMDLANFFGPAS